MTARILSLATARAVTKAEVERAYACYRALILAEVNDRSLADDLAHQEACEEAKATYLALFDEWDGS
jgi:hypothetical protein